MPPFCRKLIQCAKTALKWALQMDNAKQLKKKHNICQKLWLNPSPKGSAKTDAKPRVKRDELNGFLPKTSKDSLLGAWPLSGRLA